MKWRTSGARYASFPGCASSRQPLTKRLKKRKHVAADPKRRSHAEEVRLVQWMIDNPLPPRNWKDPFLVGIWDDLQPKIP